MTLKEKSYSALLFDMDGTILSSIASAERVWTRWAERHGLDVATFLPTIHGVRAIETIRNLGLPGVDPDVEAALLADEEMADVDGISEIAGAGAFLASLPIDRWAIVTSAPRALALARLGAAGITPPKFLIAAEDVARGKPAPDCFLLAAEQIGCSARDCLVFEDAPAGIKAATAAGASIAVVTATHAEPMETPHATIPHFKSLRAFSEESGIRVATLR